MPLMSPIITISGLENGPIGPIRQNSYDSQDVDKIEPGDATRLHKPKETFIWTFDRAVARELLKNDDFHAIDRRMVRAEKQNKLAKLRQAEVLKMAIEKTSKARLYALWKTAEDDSWAAMQAAGKAAERIYRETLKEVIARQHQKNVDEASFAKVAVIIGIVAATVIAGMAIQQLLSSSRAATVASNKSSDRAQEATNAVIQEMVRVVSDPSSTPAQIAGAKAAVEAHQKVLEEANRHAEEIARTAMKNEGVFSLSKILSDTVEPIMKAVPWLVGGAAVLYFLPAIARSFRETAEEIRKHKQSQAKTALAWLGIR